MNIKDTLKDLITHTLPANFDSVKYTCTEDGVDIASITDDRTVMLMGKTHQPVEGLTGVFGVPNLTKLSALLALEPYAENGVLELNSREDGTPTNVHFENEDGSFKNDHRLMSTEVVNDKIKKVTMKREPKYDVTLEPSDLSIQRFGWQASISDEEVFAVKTDGDHLKFLFGDQSTHAGEFIFANDVEGNMSGNCLWYVNRVLPIIKLDGDIKMEFSDEGILRITVDSGVAVYNYMLPATTR